MSSVSPETNSLRETLSFNPYVPESFTARKSRSSVAASEESHVSYEAISSKLMNEMVDLKPKLTQRWKLNIKAEQVKQNLQSRGISNKIRRKIKNLEDRTDYINLID